MPDERIESTPGAGPTVNASLEESLAPPQRSLKRNIVYAVGGTGALNLCRCGVVVLLAKFASVEVLGQFNYAMAVSTLVVMGCGLALRGALVSDAAGTFTWGAYQALRASGMVAAGAALAVWIFWESLGEPNAAFLIIFASVACGKILLALGEICWGAFQRHERLDLPAWGQALRGVVMVASFAVFVPLFGMLVRRGDLREDQLAYGVACAGVTYVLGWALIYWSFERRRVRTLPGEDPRWDWASVRRLAVQTFPLGIVLLLLTLADRYPWLVIEQQPDGMTNLGYFGALAYITMAGNMLVTQAGIAASNRLARYYQANLRAFVRLALKLIALALLAAGATMAATLLFGEWLLGVLYRAEYVEYFDSLVILVAAQCILFFGSLFGITLTQMRLFWVQVPIQLVIVGTTVLAAHRLIPSDPVRGGAWTVLVRSVAQTVLYGACAAAGVWHRRRASTAS